MSHAPELWPALPLDDWQETKDTLHMYCQIVGKIRLALAPKMNHWWNVALTVTARGLTTGPMAFGHRIVELRFDFFEHALVVETGDGVVRRLVLGGPVKHFYAELMGTLKSLGIEPAIWPVPVEVANPIRFDEDDRHHVYDPARVCRFFRVLAHVERAFNQYRAGFTGKASPVLFYWGSFDLAVSCFSGRPAEPPPELTGFMREAFGGEEVAVGFWPGGDWPLAGRIDRALFYAYAYPRPQGIEAVSLRPEAAHWQADLGEFVLDYEDVRRSAHPFTTILEFAQSALDAGARLAAWPGHAGTPPIVMLRESGVATPPGNPASPSSP